MPYIINFLNVIKAYNLAIEHYSAVATGDLLYTIIWGCVFGVCVVLVAFWREECDNESNWHIVASVIAAILGCIGLVAAVVSCVNWYVGVHSIEYNAMKLFLE